MRLSRVLGVLAVSASLMLAACGDGGSSPSSSSSSSATPASVRLQLQWTDRAQFAGYYAAEQQGYTQTKT
jgi:NitT/TauT family transport system substrate-binding protein